MISDSRSKRCQPGKVYLVGAGPGHPELLTLKAAQLLRDADVVVYDRLIQEDVLTFAKPSAERIYMGKPVGKHESRQDEIHEMLAAKAWEGKTVVRLKGGDPFLFGRGGEEAEYLADQGVPFEVVPGVSSALAAPLAAGIAVTHRDASSAVAIVTGHEAKKQSSSLDWSALSQIETLVFLMGVSNVGVIAGKLVENGRSPDTPAAMIQMAFWHAEQVVTGTLATIDDAARNAQIRPPATLVVGKVVGMREKLRRSKRDLERRHDRAAHFDPGPAPDQLLRLAVGGLGSQVLRLALTFGLFDRLEDFASASKLARGFGLNTAALEEVLDALVSLGLIERGPQGYRNLELASRYLRENTLHSLKPAALYLASQSGRGEALARYLLNGSRDLVTNGTDGQYQAACESLACYTAPAVTERLELQRVGAVLLIGRGVQAYEEAIKRRWPESNVRSCRPFLGEPVPADIRYGAVVLSGLLSCCRRGEIQRTLDVAASALLPEGLLAFHDAFLPVCALPPPEVVLGSIGRHMLRGGCRTWSVGRLRSALLALGFTDLRTEPLPAGTVLVTATRRK